MKNTRERKYLERKLLFLLIYSAVKYIHNIIFKFKKNNKVETECSPNIKKKINDNKNHKSLPKIK